MSSTKSLLGRKNIAWGLAAICWTLFIAYLCLIKSKNFSRFETFDLEHKDKYVHFTFYLFFTILWYKYIVRYSTDAVKTKWLVFCIAIAYGIGIEILQGTIDSIGRSADIYDVLANTTGSLFGLMAIKFFEKNQITK